MFSLRDLSSLSHLSFKPNMQRVPGGKWDMFFLDKAPNVLNMLCSPAWYLCVCVFVCECVCVCVCMCVYACEKGKKKPLMDETCRGSWKISSLISTLEAVQGVYAPVWATEVVYGYVFTRYWWEWSFWGCIKCNAHRECFSELGFDLNKFFSTIYLHKQHTTICEHFRSVNGYTFA